MENEWFVVGAIIAAPFAVFLIAELIALRRRRRERAIAQRPKNCPRAAINRSGSSR